MQEASVHLNVHDPLHSATTRMYVLPIAPCTFRALENELLFDERISYGTEFETSVDEDGWHKIVRITRPSPYSTHQFFLHPQHSEDTLQSVGAAIVAQGGFWQVDFGGIITINLAPYSSLTLADVVKKLV